MLVNRETYDLLQDVKCRLAWELEGVLGKLQLDYEGVIKLNHPELGDKPLCHDKISIEGLLNKLIPLGYTLKMELEPLEPISVIKELERGEIWCPQCNGEGVCEDEFLEGDDPTSTCECCMGQGVLCEEFLDLQEYDINDVSKVKE